MEITRMPLYQIKNATIQSLDSEKIKKHIYELFADNGKIWENGSNIKKMLLKSEQFDYELWIFNDDWKNDKHSININLLNDDDETIIWIEVNWDQKNWNTLNFYGGSFGHTTIKNKEIAISLNKLYNEICINMKSEINKQENLSS